MKYWGGTSRLTWSSDSANNRARSTPDRSSAVPRTGDIVLKPFIEAGTYRQLFRVETWQTHDLLDGPFDDVRAAMDAAFEFGMTARLVVWLDYSDDPLSHDLDTLPLYFADNSAGASSSAA